MWYAVKLNTLIGWTDMELLPELKKQHFVNDVCRLPSIADRKTWLRGSEQLFLIVK